MAQPPPHPRPPAEAPARPPSLPPPRSPGEPPLGSRLASRVPRSDEPAVPDEAADGPPQAPSPPPESPPAPIPKIQPTHRPILHPWEAADFDPEVTGEWGQHQSTDAPRSRRTSRRLMLLGLAVAAALGAVVVWPSARGPKPAQVLPAPAPFTPPPPPLTPEFARQAAAVARQFLDTTTVDDRARFVRHPEVTRDRMRAWHTPDNPLQPLTVLSFHDRWADERVGNHSFVMLYLEAADFTTRAIAMERLPDGSLLVDWESFESWSEIPWTRYLETEPTDPLEFRVVVERDTYYNFAYKDAAQWVCFRLNDPANEAHCWGYCPVGSEAAAALGHLLRRQRQQGNPQGKAILRLRFAPGPAGRRQVIIEALVQDHWLKPDP